MDREAEDILNKELALVDAGYVDRKTAARAGRLLSARYTVSATVRKGANDIECYLRLIHTGTGHVVARADVYGEAAEAADQQRFFQAVAGYLRQIFR